MDPQTLLLTGLTRDGVYLVEDGEVIGAVNNFRFNESPVDMLGRLPRSGATVPTLPREWGDYFNRGRMPPLRVEGFNMSSVSQASLRAAARRLADARAPGQPALRGSKAGGRGRRAGGGIPWRGEGKSRRRARAVAGAAW